MCKLNLGTAGYETDTIISLLKKKKNVNKYGFKTKLSKRKKKPNF